MISSLKITFIWCDRVFLLFCLSILIFTFFLLIFFKRIFLTKTYDVEDNVLWKPDVSTILVTSQNMLVGGSTEPRLCLNNPIDLPSAFVMSGTIKRVGSYNQQVLIGCGENKDSMYEFPVLRSNGNMTFRKNTDGTLPIDEYAFGTNTDVPFSYTYDGNGNHTLSVNNISRTVTSSAISIDKFISLQLGSNGRLSNLKIKPL